MFTCDRCRSTEFYMEPHGPHIGLFCSKCGKWLTWLKQPQNIETGENASAEQRSLVFRILNNWKLGGKPMTKRQAGAIISAFKE